MKIKRINHIKEYKSFVDFKWSEFCIDSAGGEKSFCPYNVLFDENGSGKSSICDILKDISQNTSFSANCDKPNSIQIKIDGNLHNYTANAWDNTLPKKFYSVLPQPGRRKILRCVLKALAPSLDEGDISTLDE